VSIAGTAARPPNDHHVGALIDLHCHILPDIDDGPTRMADSVALARAQVAAGVHTVAATPHVSPGMPNSAARIEAAVASLRAALADAGVPLDVVPGAEVDLALAATLPDEELERLRLGGGPWLLIEAPLSPRVQGVDILLRHLRSRGHALLIAHPERCPDFQRRPEALAGLLGDRTLVQVTAGALTQQFGRQVARYARRLVADGSAHVVASDAHDTLGRPPGLSADLALAGLGSEERVRWLTEEMPRAILDGAPLPPPPAAPSRGGPLQRFRRAGRSPH
jgi:protein-tyrosine phosphatase